MDCTKRPSGLKPSESQSMNSPRERQQHAADPQGLDRRAAIAAVYCVKKCRALRIASAAPETAEDRCL